MYIYYHDDINSNSSFGDYILMVNAILHIEAREDQFDDRLNNPEIRRMLIELLLNQILDKFEDCIKDIEQGKASIYFKLIDDRNIENNSNNK